MLQALADFLAGPRYVASSTNRSSRAPRIALCYPISFLPDALYYPFSSRERAGDLASDPPEAHGSSAGWGSALPILGSGSVCNWRAGNSARSRLSAGSGRLKRRLRPRLAALQGDATQMDPLPNPEPIEHRDFDKIRDEGKDRCRHEYSSDGEYRQRAHGDSTNRQRRGDRHIDHRRSDEPRAWTSGAHVLAFPIGVGGCLIAEHYGHEGHCS